MSLLYKETFNQYPVGHNLIGVGNMDWTHRYNQAGSTSGFDVTAEKWGYFHESPIGGSRVACSQNHPNIINMTDGKITFHPKQHLGVAYSFLFRYSATGGYLLEWIDNPWQLILLYKFNSWNVLNGLVQIASWGPWPSSPKEFEITLSGNNISLVIDNNYINNINDAAHASGTIGMFTLGSGWKIDDIYVYDNNSITPVAPINLTLTILNANAIKLNFDNLAFNADFISIERKNGAGGTFLEIDRAPGNAQSYIDRYCQPGNDYYYRVRAVQL